MIFAYIFHHGENRNEKPEMNVKRNYLHLFHFRYWQHVTTWDCEKWYFSGNTRLCIRDPRNLHLCDFVRCHCHSWWWHKRTHACAHMDLEVHLEYTFLANNSQEAQYQCKLYDFLQSKSGKQLTSIKKVLLFVSYFRLTLNFILSFPQYVRLVMFSTWNCLATLRLVSENWQKKTLGHLLVKYTKLWINYCAHSINMTQRKFRQHNLMLKHSYIIFIQFAKLCRKFSELRNETSENVMQFRKMHYDNEMDDCNIIVSFHFSHII